MQDTSSCCCHVAVHIRDPRDPRDLLRTIQQLLLSLQEDWRQDLLGEAVEVSGVPRDELFLTVKLHPQNHFGVRTQYTDSSLVYTTRKRTSWIFYPLRDGVNLCQASQAWNCWNIPPLACSHQAFCINWLQCLFCNTQMPLGTNLGCTSFFMAILSSQGVLAYHSCICRVNNILFLVSQAYSTNFTRQIHNPANPYNPLTTLFGHTKLLLWISEYFITIYQCRISYDQGSFWGVQFQFQ